MFDRDKSGTITFDEFGALWRYVTDWQETFKSFDRDNSGNIDQTELKTGEILHSSASGISLLFLSASLALSSFGDDCTFEAP